MRPSTFPKAPPPVQPQKPMNPAKHVAQAVNSVVGLPAQAVNLLNDGFAQATASIAAVFPSFPAAVLFSPALGLPHAHILHPPSGPAPIPPTPLPPFGPVMFGTCVSVLIGGLPAARCGDLGIGPTCCGLPPIYEVFTGSSNVFIGGARAARMTDVTYHCKPVPPAGAASRGLALAMRVASVALNVAGKVGQTADIVGDVIDSQDTSDAVAAASASLNATVKAAQMANDAIATAMGAAMGKDACVPPGTLGMITTGVPNVLIGGFPMPSWMNVAKGLGKLLKGMKRKGGKRQGKAQAGPSHKK